MPSGAAAPITPVGQEGLPDLSAAGATAASAFGAGAGAGIGAGTGAGIGAGTGAGAASALPIGTFDPVTGAVGDAAGGVAGLFFARGGRVPHLAAGGPIPPAAPPQQGASPMAPPPMAKPPAPPHVLMANGGEDPEDDGEGAGPMGAPAAPMPAPGAPLAPAGGALPPPGGQPPGAPGAGANPMEEMLEQQFQQNLTPQELQEVTGMLTPRLTQLLTKADPALQMIVQAFSDAAGQGEPPDSGDAMDGSGGEDASDTDALSMTGSKGQYQPSYGSPNAAPGGFPRKPVGGLANAGG